MEIITFAELKAEKQFASVDDVRLESAWRSAEGWVSDRVRPITELPIPVPLQRAVILMTARYLARETSPDGMIGMGDTVAYLPKFDRDVDSAIAPYRPVVFG